LQLVAALALGWWALERPGRTRNQPHDERCIRPLDDDDAPRLAVTKDPVDHPHTASLAKVTVEPH
jgi:hypothetical protein